jgi:hypothetical protein
MGNGISYTAEQLSFLREGYRQMSRAELTAAFNARFGATRTASQIKATLAYHGYKSGRTGRFESGQKPWNTDKKGSIQPNSGSFKTGNLPHNHRPLWSERISKDGYIEISVPERNPHTGFRSRYKCKHVWIWEQAHGPTPKGHAVIFRDGDNRNFALGNLLLVPRAELLVLNLHNYKTQPEELKPSVLALAKMEAKAGIRTRPARGRKNE